MAEAKFIPEVPIKRDVQLTLSNQEARHLFFYLQFFNPQCGGLGDGPISRALRPLLES